MLMGSNIVRLTDRKYMLRLMARIRQDYEKRQQSRIEERKKNELMRTKMMILNRLIPVQDAPPEIRRYPLFQLYLYCDSIIEARQKKRSPKHVKIVASLHGMLYPETKPTEEDSDNEEEEIYMKRVIVNGVEQLVPLSIEETAAAKKKHEINKDIENGYVLTQDEYDRLHYETGAIKELRDAQTVEDMYTKAHEILGILYSYADEGRYKKMEKPNETDDEENRTELTEEVSREVEVRESSAD
ncbi:uncharacterized protein [Venturia canescens]|nr:uncharacterized protein LOC122408309 isoform X2 [Venturia canescens]XP_043270956.1 uncharacterized protein LOC122408309 isoform X2 [Venturia canescens]